MGCGCVPAAPGAPGAPGGTAASSEPLDPSQVALPTGHTGPGGLCPLAGMLLRMHSGGSDRLLRMAWDPVALGRSGPIPTRWGLLAGRDFMALN